MAGPLDPTLYATGAATGMHDVVSGNNSLFPGSTTYAARVGYDLATGWGSPNAAVLLGVLTGTSGPGAGCPSVSALSPSSGLAVGGYPLVVTGSGFGSGVPTVTIGGRPAAVTAHDQAGTSVTVTVPPGTPGTATVAVTSAGAPGAGTCQSTCGAGTSAATARSSFTYLGPQVTGVTPARGAPSGGGTVVVTGSNFTGLTSVRFGGCLLYTSPSPRDGLLSRMPSSA